MTPSHPPSSPGSFPMIRFRPAPAAGALYLLGRLVLDEALMDGRLVTCYLKRTGLVDEIEC